MQIITRNTEVAINDYGTLFAIERNYGFSLAIGRESRDPRRRWADLEREPSGFIFRFGNFIAIYSKSKSRRSAT